MGRADDGYYLSGAFDTGNGPFDMGSLWGWDDFSMLDAAGLEAKRQELALRPEVSGISRAGYNFQGSR